MIASCLGKVEMTEPKYDIADRIGAPHEDVDIAVKVILQSDLGCVLEAMILRYGIEEAIKLWTEVAEVTVKENINAQA